MVKTTRINIEPEVVGLFAKADALQVSACLEQSITQGMSVFGFPARAIPRVWMLSVNKIKLMWKERRDAPGWSA
jgi:hypothetical protein